MKELTAEQIILINAYLIKRYSPKEIIGVRDSGALDMCINSIHATVMGEEIYSTITEKASILFINLIKKHVFHNANKRTAYVVLHAFLEKNNIMLNFNESEGAQLAVDVATWKGSFDDLKAKVLQDIQNNIVN